MNYYEKSIIDTIKKYYPIELTVEQDNKKAVFYKKENINQFLGIDIIINDTENFIIYFFKSSYSDDHNKLINDFNENDIAFRIDSLQTLEIILNSNSLESYSNDFEEIDILFPLEDK